jgi:hypothetical protein
VGSRRSRKGAKASPPARAALAPGLEQALRWSGFRDLSLAERSAGPFAWPADETVFVRLDPAAYTIAFVTRLRDEADLVRFIDHQGPKVWGYDLNLNGHADRTAVVNELRFVVSRDEEAIRTELTWLGYALDEGRWLHVDRQCRVPAPGPAFTAPIYPCLGWVLLPGAADEFGAAEQRSGFCTTTVPAGSLANRATRGFSFVYEGYPERSIVRRRIVTVLDPARPPAEAPALVDAAMALTYGEP